MLSPSFPSWARSVNTMSGFSRPPCPTFKSCICSSMKPMGKNKLPWAPSAQLPLVCQKHPQKPDLVIPLLKRHSWLLVTLKQGPHSPPYLILFHHYLKQPISQLNQTQLQAPVFPTTPMPPIISCMGKELRLLLDTERHKGIFQLSAIQVRICCNKVGEFLHYLFFSWKQFSLSNEFSRGSSIP